MRLIPIAMLLVWTLPAADAAVPADLRAEPIAASAVRLNWSVPGESAHGCQIERRTPRDKDWRPLAVLGAGVSGYESVGVIGGDRVEHRIAAIDAKGKPGAWVEFSPVTTPHAATPEYGVVLTEPAPGFERTSEGDMIVLRDGSLLFVFGQWPTYSDDSRGVRLGARRSADGGKTWSDAARFLDDPQYDLYHPSIERLSNGEIGLTYTKRIPSEPRQHKGEKVIRWSADEGVTWSDEVVISDGNWEHHQTSAVDRLRVLSSGRLVHPVSRRRIQSKPYLVGTMVYTSDDHGRTWQRRTPEPITDTRRGMFHEAEIIEHAPGKLLMLGRTVAGRFYESRSEDNGDTWSPAAPSNIPSAVAPPKLIAGPDAGSILLVWNPFVGSTGGAKALGPRLTLAMWRSDDGGRTWHGYRELVTDPQLLTSARNGYTGFCYASGTWLDRTLHLTYTDYFGSDRDLIRIRYLPLRFETAKPARP